MPPVDRERNREVIAERLGWPYGALAACRELEACHPGWSVVFNTGGLPSQPEPAYVAYLAEPWHGYRPRLAAPTAAELDALIAAEDEVRPRQRW